jgi:hypothetical protein
MDLKVLRKELTSRSTIGELLVDGEFACYTLEDAVRPVKIKGVTAIPAGIYEVVINFSQRFKRPLPLLLNVPNFDGVRIHAGNTDADTEGCLLGGNTKGRDVIGASRAAFDALCLRIQQAAAKEKVFIEFALPGDAVQPASAMRGAGSVRRRLTAAKKPRRTGAAKPSRAPARKRTAKKT